MSNETLLKFERLNKSIQLKEGTRGLIKVLSVIDRFPNKPIRFISQKSGLPIPIGVAIRNEFCKREWCRRTKKGTVITKQGRKILNNISGLNKDFQCKKCNGMGVYINFNDYSEELSFVEKYAKMRGEPNTTIDQSFSTPTNSLKRALFMSHNYDLSYGDIALIGDSDLTSIALAQLISSNQKIVAFDIDKRIGGIIKKANRELKNKIEFKYHDFKKPIPKNYQNKFSLIHTDPPYTVTGLKLFLSRALETLEEEGGVIYLSFVIKPPREMLDIQKNLGDMNCLITHVIPHFNKYMGAQKLGGESGLLRLLAVSPLSIPFTEEYKGEIYTGEYNPIKRIYQCLNCKKTITIGKNSEFHTIEELKNKQCPHCKEDKFKKIKEKKIE